TAAKTGPAANLRAIDPAATGTRHVLRRRRTTAANGDAKRAPAADLGRVILRLLRRAERCAAADVWIVVGPANTARPPEGSPAEQARQHEQHDDRQDAEQAERSKVIHRASLSTRR